MSAPPEQIGNCETVSWSRPRNSWTLCRLAVSPKTISVFSGTVSRRFVQGHVLFVQLHCQSYRVTVSLMARNYNDFAYQ